MKDIKISDVMVRTPNVIQVDGIIYPRTVHNVKVVREYWETNDERVLDKLSEIVLEF